MSAPLSAVDIPRYAGYSEGMEHTYNCRVKSGYFEAHEFDSECAACRKARDEAEEARLAAAPKISVEEYRSRQAETEARLAKLGRVDEPDGTWGA
jgi:hypothetical protein